MKDYKFTQNKNVYKLTINGKFMDGTPEPKTDALPVNAENSVEPVYLAHLILTLSMEALGQEISIQGVFN